MHIGKVLCDKLFTCVHGNDAYDAKSFTHFSAFFLCNVQLTIVKYDFIMISN